MSHALATRPDRGTLLYWAAVVNAELLVVLLYLLFVTGPPDSLRFVLLVTYPFVWLNVAWWAYRSTDPPAAGRRTRVGAGALAAGYFLLLAYVGGLVQPGIGDLATGFRVVTYQVPPGFAPAVLYSGSAVVVNLIPFKLAGYLALAYLVYVTALDVSGSVAAGVVGLLSCVSCTFPVIAAIVSGVTGSAAFAATVAGGSYGLSTLAFLVTVGLLRWRPDVSDLSRLRSRIG
ncbi:DUF7546 family protein [Halorarius halobius]|uniref:DUF7546 family protein n=1 Tax=Halorarius halobius TaxID=2962671 RepID=UPI0020CBE601|nr:hypothetical protein [Halorarius halobius]